MLKIGSMNVYISSLALKTYFEFVWNRFNSILFKIGTKMEMKVKKRREIGSRKRMAMTKKKMVFLILSI